MLYELALLLRVLVVLLTPVPEKELFIDTESAQADLLTNKNKLDKQPGVCVCVCLSVCLSVCVSVCVSVCLSVCQSVFYSARVEKTRS